MSNIRSKRLSKCACCLLLSALCFFALLPPASAHIRLDTPEGGIALEKGSVFTIQWDAYLFHGPGTISLEFSDDKGETFTPIVSGISIQSANEAVGTYEWTVPDVDSAFCRIKALYIAETGGIYRFTSSPFTIGFPTIDEEEEIPKIGQYRISIPPSKDNTLYQYFIEPVSNGAGQYLFAGRTNTGLKRRGLIAFDMPNLLPAGASIVHATLTINVSKVAVTNEVQISLIPMLADWGESTSDAPNEEGGGAQPEDGDATWDHNFSPTGLWDNSGGDFDTGVSSSVTVSNLDSYVFPSTIEFIDEIQRALDTPETHFGWLIAGNESLNKTAVRFDSREHPTISNRPSLNIDFDYDGDFPESGTITRNDPVDYILGETRIELYAPAGSSHQWFKDGEALTDDIALIRDIQGSRTDTLILNPILAEDEGEYHSVYLPESLLNTGLVQTEPFTLRQTTSASSSSDTCFIATAAFGTPLAGEIDVLRGFRDDHLLGSYVGMAAVDSYYRVSPPIADFISRNELSKTMVRVMIVTLIASIEMFSGGSGLLGLALVIAGSILLIRGWRRGLLSRG